MGEEGGEDHVMHRMKDSSFYNQESTQYSAKRYPPVATTYIQFFFKERLRLTIEQLKAAVVSKEHLTLLEVGCADGVVLREISKQLDGVFSKLVGIDTAEGMVAQARVHTTDSRTQFFLRGEEVVDGPVDVIVEIGVANYADIDEELKYTHEHLADDGVYILSLAGKGSLNAFFGKGVGYRNFLLYRDYEQKIAALFRVETVIPCGFFVPLLWRMPRVARMVQPAIEKVMAMIMPNVFHEKIYILRKR